MIGATLRVLGAFLMPPPTTGEGEVDKLGASPEAIAVRLISDLAPAISVAVWQGNPLERIRRDVIASQWPIWERHHGRPVAAAAERFLMQLGPVAFLSDDEARRAGLLLLTPTRGKRRWPHAAQSMTPGATR